MCSLHSYHMVYLEHRKRKDGTVYVYLCRKQRVAGKVKRTLNLYLGREDQITQSFPAMPKISDLKTVSFGYVAALWQAAERLGLRELVNKYTRKSRAQGLPVGDYVTLAAINRVDEPCSKAGIQEWHARTWLATKLPAEAGELSSQAYWNHLSYLTDDAIAKIEEGLDSAIMREFHASLEFLLYDATNFHTFIQTESRGDLPKRGKAKSGRRDLNLVALSLAVTRKEGFPVLHHAYAGNTHDSKHFKAVIPTLLARCVALKQACEGVTVVFDKGNNSPGNVAALRKDKFHYVASLRPTSYEHLLDLPESEFERITLRNGKEVLVHESREEAFELADQRVVVAKDKRSELRSKYKLMGRLAYITRELAELRGKLNQGVWAHGARVDAKVAKILKRRAGACLVVAVTGEDAELSMTVELDGEQFASMADRYGRTILTTDHEEWTAAEVVEAYRGQHVVEKDFKEMKCADSVRATPMYHWTDQKIKAHLFLCVIAFLLKVAVREMLEEKGQQPRPSKIKSILGQVRLVTGTLNDAKEFSQLSNMKGESEVLATALGLPALLDENGTLL